MGQAMYYKLLKLKNRVYDAAKIDWDHMMFDRSAIWKLLIPLMIENLLASFMGMADSMMVTRIGSAAISAVSLTDSINNLVIQLFSAMATGGTILCSQYIGSGDPKKANAAARQVVLSMTSIAIVITLFSEALNTQILRLVFGSVEPAVLSAAETYFRFTAASFPFLGLYQIGAAFYRAGGNSRFPMKVSVISNVMNIIGNAIFIFGFGWGVAGAALSTLLSRILAAIILFVFLRKPKQVIVLRDYRIQPDFDMIARILAIGIPSGIENSMFQFGKLAIQSSVSTLGTTAIAAQAMAIIFENINGIGGLAVGIGLMTMVGQTLGAGRKEEANVLKHQWVVPEPELIVVAQGEAPDHHPGDQKGQPGPTQQEIHQKQSQNHRQDVQHRDKGVLEIAFHQHVRVVAVGEKQRQHPQAQARQQQNQSVPKPEGRFLSSGKSDGRTLEQPKVFQMGHLFCEKQD